MPTGLRTLDLRWPPAREALARAIPKLIEVGGDQLNERERRVLELFSTGINAETIGAEIGNAFTRNRMPVSRARVNQILHRAIQKILSAHVEKLMKAGMGPEEAWAEAEQKYINFKELKRGES